MRVASDPHEVASPPHVVPSSAQPPCIAHVASFSAEHGVARPPHPEGGGPESTRVVLPASGIGAGASSSPHATSSVIASARSVLLIVASIKRREAGDPKVTGLVVCGDRESDQFGVKRIAEPAMARVASPPMTTPGVGASRPIAVGRASAP